MSKLHVYSDALQRSRSSISACCGALALVLLPAAGAAQTRADSLEERLRRAEAAIAVLQGQVAEQAQSAVQSAGRGSVRLTGSILLTAFGNSRRVNNVDNPQFVVPDAATSGRGGGMSLRQTRLGITASHAHVMGGQFLGDVDVDFYGGQMPSGGGRHFPLLRLRTARATVRWTHAHLMIGQESPLVSDVDPVTVSAVGTPGFAAAGNLWLWLPQIRGGVTLPQSLLGARVGVQGAVLAPTSGDPALAFDTDVDIAERSQRPFLQGRAFVAWTTADESTSEVGCGVHQGWLMSGPRRVSSDAFACDMVVRPLDWLDVRGEWFTGHALRGLGGGAIGQNFTPLNEPLRTKGGWAQLNVRRGALGAGAGCGGDHPLTAATRHRNDVCAAYSMLRPAGSPLFVGVEWRRMRTGYSAGYFVNDHVTLGTGFGF